MRIIMSGGGTGGHIYPAITIVRAIEKIVQPCEVLYVGTKYGLEADIVPKEGLHFETIDVRGLERHLSWQNISTAIKTVGSLWESQKIVRKFKPDIVIGTGGYVCGPILLAASLLRIPTVIQEQNVVPGITNKILSRFVDKIAVGYEEAGRHFNKPNKVIVTGNPIRSEVMTALREKGIATLGINPNCQTVLISGGSRGAHSINAAMLEVHKCFAGKKDIQLLHITGKSEYNDIVGNLMQLGIDVTKPGNIIIKPYLYNMPEALAAADLAVFRAGAVGLAELSARGIPSILIPYPYAAENHQEFNARVMESHGAAKVIRDVELNGTRLTEMILELLHDSRKLQLMAQASKKMGRPQAADNIARLAVNLKSN